MKNIKKSSQSGEQVEEVGAVFVFEVFGLEVFKNSFALDILTSAEATDSLKSNILLFLLLGCHLLKFILKFLIQLLAGAFLFVGHLLIKKGIVWFVVFPSLLGLVDLSAEGEHGALVLSDVLDDTLAEGHLLALALI